MRAFSLVELSIVLVILGLLVGGILAGQSLIRAAELRSVATEYTRWVTATQTFRDKYMAIPGDMNNATRFWGDDNAACPDAAVTNGTPGTCNGNGDGGIGAGAAGATTEMYQFWKHLALAGLIEGTYSGLAGAGGGRHGVIGTNAPPSRLSNAGWSVQSLGVFGGDSSAFATDYGTTLFFGSQLTTDKTLGATISPEEAWNIDTKLDDGKPGQGKIIVHFWNPCTLAATFSDIDSAYELENKSKACALSFTKAF